MFFTFVLPALHVDIHTLTKKKKRHELSFFLLSRLEQQDGDLTEVEVDEILRFVSHVRTEVATNDAVPGRVVLLKKGEKREKERGRRR